jgi:serine/threonine protein kinase
VDCKASKGNVYADSSIGCKYTPKLLDSGKHEGKVNFIVLDLFGDNLATLRRRQRKKRFSLLTTLMLGRQMLRCLKEVHERGFIHRDIKPV